MFETLQIIDYTPAPEVRAIEQQMGKVKELSWKSMLIL